MLLYLCIITVDVSISTCFRLFLQKPANPDLLYIIFFCHTQLTVTLLLCLIFGSKVRRADLLMHHILFLRKLHISLICDKSVTTQNLAFLSYWYRNKRLQNSPLESSCVVIALVENYSTSKPLKVSPEKSQILICDAVVAGDIFRVDDACHKKFCIYRSYKSTCSCRTKDHSLRTHCSVKLKHLTSKFSHMYGCLLICIIIDSQLDATITHFIDNCNQLNMFRAIISPTLRSTRLCLQLVV